MALTVVGVQPVSGVYEGHEYSKLRLHCTKPLEKDGSYGSAVEFVSVNLSDCGELLESVDGVLSDLIGVQIDLYYNQYGKPAKVFLV